jgi:hypothetical protein
MVIGGAVEQPEYRISLRAFDARSRVRLERDLRTIGELKEDGPVFRSDFVARAYWPGRHARRRNSRPLQFEWLGGNHRSYLGGSLGDRGNSAAKGERPDNR